MKKYILLIVSWILLLSSCSKFTEIDPKGINLLTTTTQLDMLLNKDYVMDAKDVRAMCGDLINVTENVPNLISNPNKTRASIIITWDESAQDKMAELTTTDLDYSKFYSVIGKIANPILLKADKATGTQVERDQLKCEALVLRAYFHYLLVNKFAKAYNPATAKTDPGIPYVTEEWDLTVPTIKVSVQEVYDNILKDIDEAIKIDGLRVEAANRMRISKPCVYAVKALALLSMQRLDEAEKAAKQSLDIYSQIANYNETITWVTSYTLGKKYPVILRTKLKCVEDIFSTFNIEYMAPIPAESWSLFEQGHACKDKMTTDRLMFDNLRGVGMTYIGVPDCTLTFDQTSGWNSVGIKTTEMYLVIAEVEISKGNIEAAMDALDKIRVNRINADIFKPLKGAVTTKVDAIAHLKQTSHGENIYSYYNFINRKRWNLLDGYKATYTKTIDGVTYKLTPESHLWIFPFPGNAINNNPNLLPQNYK